jgi:hypothetical protein
MEHLSQEQLEFFASLTEEQCENYRQQKYPNYMYLKFISEKINNMEIDSEGKLEELLQFKQIMADCPCPNDAKQELNFLNTGSFEPCSDCSV